MRNIYHGRLETRQKLLPLLVGRGLFIVNGPQEGVEELFIEPGASAEPVKRVP